MTNIAKIAAEKKLRARGYVPANEIAAIFGMHVGSIYRWIADGDVEAIKLGNRRFISRQSVIAKVGVETASAFGFVLHAKPATASVDIEVET